LENENYDFSSNENFQRSINYFLVTTAVVDEGVAGAVEVVAVDWGRALPPCSNSIRVVRAEVTLEVADVSGRKVALVALQGGRQEGERLGLPTIDRKFSIPFEQLNDFG